jgi:hypothetical protein
VLIWLYFHFHPSPAPYTAGTQLGLGLHIAGSRCMPTSTPQAQALAGCSHSTTRNVLQPAHISTQWEKFQVPSDLPS